MSGRHYGSEHLRAVVLAVPHEELRHEHLVSAFAPDVRQGRAQALDPLDLFNPGKALP